MNIECEYDPNDLIPLIGDRQFDICDDTYADGEWKHKNHPRVIRIIDCEDGVSIDVSSDYGIKETRIMAEALLKLLNQEYRRWV